jgi:hypothetical protein
LHIYSKEQCGAAALNITSKEQGNVCSTNIPIQAKLLSQNLRNHTGTDSASAFADGKA